MFPNPPEKRRAGWAPRAVDTVELSGRRESGLKVRVLLLAGATAWRTYGVTVTTARRPSQRRVAEAAGILASVELQRPEAVRAEPRGGR